MSAALLAIETISLIEEEISLVPEKKLKGFVGAVCSPELVEGLTAIKWV